MEGVISGGDQLGKMILGLYERKEKERQKKLRLRRSG
jgi:hypothetical protein